MLAKRNVFDSLLHAAGLCPFENAQRPGWVEKEKKYILTLEVPGFTEKDIKVELKEGYLTIVAKSEQKGDVFSSSKYLQQTVYLPEDVETENIDAELKSGILAITVPKIVLKDVEGKEIPVKALK